MSDPASQIIIPSSNASISIGKQIHFASAVANAGVLPLGPSKSLGLDFPDRFMASTPFSVNPDAAGPSFTK
jgi:hypothetical protein